MSRRARAVRQPGKKAVSKVVRYQYDLPAAMASKLDMWAASCKEAIYPDRIVFVDDREIGGIRGEVVTAIEYTCEILTTAQRHSSGKLRPLVVAF